MSNLYWPLQLLESGRARRDLDPAAPQKVIGNPHADPFNPVCFGIACNIHGSCARYQAVDGAQDEIRMDWCGVEHPHYVAVVPG